MFSKTLNQVFHFKVSVNSREETSVGKLSKSFATNRHNRPFLSRTLHVAYYSDIRVELKIYYTQRNHLRDRHTPKRERYQLPSDLCQHRCETRRKMFINIVVIRDY